MHGLSQEDWIKQAGEEIRCYSDRLIRMRNKPRPNNKWWGTDIKDSLVDAHCLVTNMSLSAIDAVLNMTPVICHGKNVCSPIASRDLKYANKPFRPGRKTVTEWMKFVVENQFTLPEIESGKAFEVMKNQIV